MWIESLVKLIEQALPVIGKWLQIIDRKADDELAKLKALDERVKASEPTKPPGLG